MKVVIFVLALLLFASISFADEIQGNVAAIDAKAATMVISGVQVDAGSASFTYKDEPITIVNIKVGDSILAKGSFVSPARLRATDVAKLAGGFSALRGTIATISPDKRELVISGIKVKVAADAMVRGRQEEKTILDLLEPGFYVDCAGSWSGPAEFAASSIKAD